MVIVKWDKTHNDTIVELRIITGRKSDWKDTVEPFLAVLKAFIPVSHRNFDPVTKLWEIATEYWLAIEMAVKQMSNIRLQQKSHVSSWEASNFGHKKVEVPKDYEQNFFHEAPPTSGGTPVNKISIKDKLELLLEVKISTQPIEELKKIYRQKAMQYHPDRNNGDGTKMSELNSVWSEYTK